MSAPSEATPRDGLSTADLLALPATIVALAWALALALGHVTRAHAGVQAWLAIGTLGLGLALVVMGPALLLLRGTRARRWSRAWGAGCWLALAGAASSASLLGGGGQVRVVLSIVGPVAVAYGYVLAAGATGAPPPASPT